MKTSTQSLETAATPGIFQPVFTGSSRGHPYMVYGPRKIPPPGGGGGGGVALPSPPIRSFTLGGGTPPATRRHIHHNNNSHHHDSSSSNNNGGSVPDPLAQPDSTTSSYEASFSLFGSAEVGQDSWNIFSSQTNHVPAATPEIRAVNIDFASELGADGLADSLLNTAAAVAAQPAVMNDTFNLSASAQTTAAGEDSFSTPSLPSTTVSSGSSSSSSSSNSSSSPTSSSVCRVTSANGAAREEHVVSRPDLTPQMIEDLNDVTEFTRDEKYQKHLIEYRDKISFPIGEGGRELLRACLNVRGCKGRQLQGASVPVLLQLAHQWNLWDVALRIKIERQTGQLSPAHEAFVRFKATQSQLRKYVRKEYMVTERDQSGKISRIHYDENRKIKLGKDGRESLRAKLRRLHDKHANRMDELLAQHGFKYSELRNATVQQLGRMAFVCNLWDQVVSACRSQEEKRDGRGGKSGISVSGGGIGGNSKNEIKLPLNLINEPIVTDENGQMSNADARRTMAAVSELLQQSYGKQGEDETALSQDIFSSANFTVAFDEFTPTCPDVASLPPMELIKQEPQDDQEDAASVATAATPPHHQQQHCGEATFSDLHSSPDYFSSSTGFF